MNVFIMHVGSAGSIDLEYTVTRKRSTSELLEQLPANAPERAFFSTDAFLSRFPEGRFNCWGVPVKAEPSFQKTKVGDVVLFIPEIGEQGGVDYLGVVKAICPIRCYDASHILWPKTPNERLFPWLFFFDTEIVHVPWSAFLNELGMAPNWNPRGWYRAIGNQRFAIWGGTDTYLQRIRQNYGFAPIDPEPQVAEVKELPEAYKLEEPEIEEVIEAVSRAAGKRRPSAGQGFQVPPKHRRALEQAAMQTATDYFENLNWDVEDVSLRKSYDLRCTKGQEEIHVEVKGTTSEGEQVLLTPNEVRHAREYYPNVVLFIVSKLNITTKDDTIEVHDGNIEILWPWRVEDTDLTPIGYTYRVPDE